MNYDEMMKAGRIEAVREFFRLHDRVADNNYLDWFYTNFLGICKNMGFLRSNDQSMDDSPYAEFALQIYDLGH